MKKFLAVILFIAAAVIAGYGIRYAVMPPDTQNIKYVTRENAVSVKGFVIRDEWVMLSRGAGTAYYTVSEGERAAKDSVIVSVFGGNVSEDSIKELDVVDSKIKLAREDKRQSSVSEPDSQNVENSIYKRENDIIDAAMENDILSVSKYKKDINSLRANNEFSADDTLKELESERWRILGGMGVRKEDRAAEISGIFTTYIDGCEELLSPGMIDDIDLSYFMSLPKENNTRQALKNLQAGSEICKVVNNHVWYITMMVPQDAMNGHEEGEGILLRLNGAADRAVKAEIYRVSGAEKGNVIVTAKCPEYLETAFSYRYVDADIIFDSYSGYEVPVYAIHTDDDGRQRVIGISGGRTYDCYCDVLYVNTGNEYAIIESAQDAENRLSQVERIVTGERYGIMDSIEKGDVR